MLGVVRVGLYWHGYSAMRLWAERPRCCAIATLTVEEASALGQVVNLAARHSPFTVTCLPRSLWLQRVLRERGLDSELCIGVKLGHDGFAAHAWVEWRSSVLNDTPDFVGLYSRMPHGYDPAQS
jgi:peroxiredoxin